MAAQHKGRVEVLGVARREVNSTFCCEIAAFMLVATAMGCTGPSGRTVPRVVDGSVVEGPVVSPYAYEWFVAGEMAAARGRHEEAALAFEAARAAPAEDPYLLARLAESYERSGDSRRADRTIGSAGRAGPGSSTVAIARGRVLFSRGDFAGALRAYDEAYALGAQHEEVTGAQVQALRAAGAQERALTVASNAESAKHADGHAAKRQLVEDALDSGDLELIAMTLRSAGEHAAVSQKRRAAYLAWTSKQPRRTEAWIRRARGTAEDHILWVRALTAIGQAERAANALRKGPAARFGGAATQAILLLGVGQPAAALRALEQEPARPQVLFVRGRALQMLGRCADALGMFGAVPYGARDHADARRGFVACVQALGHAGEAREISEMGTE